MPDSLRVGIIGSGRIGGNVGEQLARRGHHVTFSGSRDRRRLEQLAASVPDAVAGTPREAVSDSDAVVLSVPWTRIDDALADAGPLTGRVVIDTTNQYGSQGVEDLGGATALATNAARMPGASLARAFNTLTAGFQREVGDGRVDGEVAMFFAAADETASDAATRLIVDTGFVPVRLDVAAAALMEAPHRDDGVYGEAYGPDAARRIATAAREDPALARRLAGELNLR